MRFYHKKTGARPGFNPIPVFRSQSRDWDPVEFPVSVPTPALEIITYNDHMCTIYTIFVWNQSIEFYEFTGES